MRRTEKNMPRFYAYFSNSDVNSGWRFVFAKNDVKNNFQQQLFRVISYIQ